MSDEEKKPTATILPFPSHRMVHKNIKIEKNRNLEYEQFSEIDKKFTDSLSNPHLPFLQKPRALYILLSAKSDYTSFESTLRTITPITLDSFIESTDEDKRIFQTYLTFTLHELLSQLQTVEQVSPPLALRMKESKKHIETIIEYCETVRHNLHIPVSPTESHEQMLDSIQLMYASREGDHVQDVNRDFANALERSNGTLAEEIKEKMLIETLDTFIPLIRKHGSCNFLHAETVVMMIQAYAREGRYNESVQELLQKITTWEKDDKGNLAKLLSDTERAIQIHATSLDKTEPLVAEKLREVWQHTLLLLTTQNKGIEVNRELKKILEDRLDSPFSKELASGGKNYLLQELRREFTSDHDTYVSPDIRERTFSKWFEALKQRPQTEETMLQMVYLAKRAYLKGPKSISQGMKTYLADLLPSQNIAIQKAYLRLLHATGGTPTSFVLRNKIDIDIVALIAYEEKDMHLCRTAQTLFQEKISDNLVPWQIQLDFHRYVAMLLREIRNV